MKLPPITKGPWSIAPCIHDKRLGICGPAGVVVCAPFIPHAEMLAGVQGKANAKAIAAVPAMLEAGCALIADIRRRYPGEELRCEYMRALDAALRLAGAGDE